jgi:hypothetical protein
VDLAADDDPERRGSRQPVAFHVPPGASEHLVTCGGEGGEICHVAAGHETDAGVGGQVQDVEQPPSRDFLRDGRCRRHHIQTRRLVPAGRERVCRGGRRERATRHEAEISRSGRGDEAGTGGCGELVDYARRVGRPFGCRAVECAPQFSKRR